VVSFEEYFRSALTYGAFLERYAAPDHQRQWAASHERIRLSPTQRELLRGFVRQMNVLCMAGAWCPDCAMQCPIFEHFAHVTPRINLRFIDRDADAQFQEELRLCGGARVPVVIFLSEEFHECARCGDRTLAQYRALVASLSGAGSATPADLQSAIVEDWLREFERVQLMLRHSPRLRQRHGD